MDDYFVPTSKDRYLVSGLPEANVASYLESLYASAPIQMLPPVIYFSSPSESAFSAGSPWQPPVVGNDYTPQPIRADLVTYSFKNLFNPLLRRTELCAAVCMADGTPLSEFRSKMLGITSDEAFVPYFVIAVDPVRSSASRSFCLSVANALHKRPMAFDLIPTSLPAIVGNYNPQTVAEFPAAP